MPLTIEQLQSKRAQYAQAKAQHEAEANACIGAISFIDELIAAMQTAPADPTASIPNPESPIPPP